MTPFFHERHYCRHPLDRLNCAAVKEMQEANNKETKNQ